tara:strand:+ start:976 stop:1152 length:177 start_codon:yes stop_codon:yes gene_type:complete
MSKSRKSCMITEEAHNAMINHLEKLREKAQENAPYEINAPNMEQWISEAILMRIDTYN